MKEKRIEPDWSAPAGSDRRALRKALKKRNRARRFRQVFYTILGLAVAAAAGIHLYSKTSALSSTTPGILDSEEVNAYATQREINASSKTVSRIPVIAHRGFVDDSLENSFESFDLALSSGCPQVELDVYPSSDGVLFVSHDVNIARISGVDWNIPDKTAAELDTVTTSNGEKLHRLSEVIGRYRDQILYLVEFKWDSDDPQPFLNVVNQYPNYAENIMIQSFYPQILESIHDHLPNMFTQVLVENQEQYTDALGFDWADSLALDQSMISADVISQVHDSGREIWVWTVDDMEKVREYLSQGFNGVITDLDSAVVIYKEMTSET